MDFEFQYTDRIVNHLVKIEALKHSLLSLEVSTDIKYKLGINAKVKEVFYFANSLGLEFTLKDAEKVVTGMILDTFSDERMQLVYNYKNALDYTRSSFIDNHHEIDEPLMTHLNRLCTANWVDPTNSKMRDGNDTISTKYDNWSVLKDTSIQNLQVKEEIEDLLTWFGDVSPYMNHLVKYTIFLFRIIEIAPFIAANKPTILALIDLLFSKYNLSSKIYSSTNFIFLQNEDKVLQSFGIAKSNREISIWVQEILSLVIKSIEQTKEELQSYIMEEEKSKKQPFLDLNKRQLKILRYLQNVPHIKREEYCHMMEVSSMTAFRDLDDLVRKKLLKIDGQGRGTRYHLASM